MPRLRTTPNGFNEWLVCETVEWARPRGFTRISLNFAPFAALLAPEAELSGLQKVERRALLALKGHFQLDNLLAFNRKFFPSWERRFVVYERRRDLPRVGIAALAADFCWNVNSVHSKPYPLGNDASTRSMAEVACPEEYPGAAWLLISEAR